MAAAVQNLEEILKEYFLFRGFTNTLKAFDVELKSDKDKSFRVNRIVEQLISFVTLYDLQGIRDYWSYLRRRFFSRLDSVHLINAHKLEKCLYRFYLVNAVQTSRTDRVMDFFEKMAPELQNQLDWKEWFALPFLKNPEQNPTLEMYFSQLWQETFPLSLHNFLNAIFQSMPLPRLLKFDAERIMCEKLRQDNNLLHQEILKLQQEIAILQGDKDKKSVSNNSELQQRMDKPKVRTKEKEANFIQRRFQWGKSKEQQDKEDNVTPVLDSETQQVGNQTECLAAQRQQSEEMNSVTREHRDFDEVPQSKKTVPDPGSSELTEKFESTENDKKTVFKTTSDKNQLVTNDDSISEKNNIDDFVDPNLGEKKSVSQMSKTYPRVTPPRKTYRTSSSSSREMVDMSSNSRALGIQEDAVKPFISLSEESFSEHRSPVVQCDFSASGKLVASVDSDGIVKVWKHHPSPTTVATVMSKSSLLSIEWARKSDKLLLLGTNNGKIRLYDTETKTTRYDMSTDSQFTRIVSLACSPYDTSFVCSATEDNRPFKSVFKQALSTDQEKNMEASRQGTLLLWDLKTMKLERHLPLGNNGTRINCIVYNHNGTLLVTGGADGMIRIYDTRSNGCLLSWLAHRGPVNSVQFSVDETFVFSMGRDGQFLQWSLHKGSQTASLPTHGGMCGPSENLFLSRTKNALFTRLFTFDCTGEHLLTCAPTSGIIYKFNQSDNSLSQVFSIGGHKSHVTSVDWSTAGDFITCLTGSMNGHIRMTKLLKH